MSLQLPRALSSAVESLSEVPGLGPKSAQRILFWFLANNNKDKLTTLTQSLLGLEKIKRCSLCNSYTDDSNGICSICADKSRDPTQLAVVESFADEVALESSYSWKGLYFVLSDRFSPMESKGAKEAGFYVLMDRIDFGVSEGLKEVLVATSYTPSGDAAAYYIIEAIKKKYPKIKVTRLSRGIPTGLEIEYTDLSTLSHAMYERKEK